MQPPVPPQGPQFPPPHAPGPSTTPRSAEILGKVLVPPSVLGLLLAVFTVYDPGGRSVPNALQSAVVALVCLVDFVLLVHVSWRIAAPSNTSSLPRGLKTFLLVCALGALQWVLAGFLMFLGCACLSPLRPPRPNGPPIQPPAVERPQTAAPQP